MTDSDGIGTGTDHIRAALALGIDITISEMCLLQAAIRPGPVVALLESDPLAAAAEHDLLPELRRRLAASPDRMLAVAAGVHPAAPPGLVEATVARRELQAVLTSRPDRLPAHVIEVLAERGTQPQRRAIARAIEDAELLGRLADDPEPVVRTGVATNRHTPDRIVSRLATDERQSVRATVARRDELAPQVLRTLASDESDLVRSSAAGNNQSDDRELTVLATDDSIRVRTSVAGNALAPAHILVALSRDPSARVRARLGGNRATPRDTLRNLATDTEASVRLRVARNPSCEPDVLAGMLDRAPDSALASNRSTPSHLLDTLADRTQLIGSGSSEHARGDRTVLFELARHPQCGSALLGRLVEFGLGEPTTDTPDSLRVGVVRRLAGAQPLTDDILRRFAELGDLQVRARLATRPGDQIPADVLADLGADDQVRIARALAANTTLPNTVRESAQQRVTAGVQERRRRLARRQAERAARTAGNRAG